MHAQQVLVASAMGRRKCAEDKLQEARADYSALLHRAELERLRAKTLQEAFDQEQVCANESFCKAEVCARDLALATEQARCTESEEQQAVHRSAITLGQITTFHVRDEFEASAKIAHLQSELTQWQLAEATVAAQRSAAKVPALEAMVKVLRCRLASRTSVRAVDVFNENANNLQTDIGRVKPEINEAARASEVEAKDSVEEMALLYQNLVATLTLQQEQRWLLERETCVRNSITIPLGSSSASPRLRHPLTSNGIGFMTGETGRLDSAPRIASFQASNPDISALLPLAGRSVSQTAATTRPSTINGKSVVSSTCSVIR